LNPFDRVLFMIMKTICLKLHKPSFNKRVIIDTALSEYTEAFNYLLREANKEPDFVWEKYEDKFKGYRGDKLSKWVDSERSRKLNRFNVEPFKDSLKMDFGATYSGYLNRKILRQDAGLPGSSKDMENKQAVNLRPLLFCRYSANRDYCLLYDRENNKYYGKFYLMNNKSELKRAVKGTSERKLHYIYKNGEEFYETLNRVRYIIVPLSFGKWQEGYLSMGLKNPDIFKTARLIKKNDEYYLYINLKLDTPDEIQPETYLGICRSLKSPVYTSLIDFQGNLLKSSQICLTNHGSALKGHIDSELNTIANQIIKYAIKNKSQIIVENFSGKGDRLSWTGKNGRQYQPALSAVKYRRLVDILKYKASENALPKLILVSPVGIFHTCPQCGLNSKSNRFSHNMFLCTRCGKASNLDDLGSFNVAGKVMKYSNDSVKIKAEVMNDGVSFKLDQLGFECYLREDADMMENLEKELKMGIETFEKDKIYLAKDKSYNAKYSIVKKLKDKQDILNNVEVVVTKKSIS